MPDKLPWLSQHYLTLGDGIGGAKLTLGLSHVLTPERLTIVVNTGDDFDHLDRSIRPDIGTATGLVSFQTHFNGERCAAAVKDFQYCGDEREVTAEPATSGVAVHHAGFLDGYVVDATDQNTLPGPQVISANIVMQMLADKVTRARRCMEFCGELAKQP
jgi:hypothetical protein